MAKGYPRAWRKARVENEAYRALADERRRAVLSELLDESVIDVSELLPDGGGSGTPHHVTLHHRHLPMLAEMGYVHWDRTNDTVARGPQFDAVRPLVESHAREFDNEIVHGSESSTDYDSETGTVD